MRIIDDLVLAKAIGGGSQPTPPVPPTPAEAPENDVEFIDYDGTIVYSYTAAQFLALTEMPANPTHEGLTAQGWNWSLADAKEYVGDYGGLVIGQMYITDDGKTRIYITIPEGTPIERRNPNVNVWMYSGQGTGYSVDFGDGNGARHFTTIGNASITPIAPLDTGDYVITVEADENSDIYLGAYGNPNEDNSSNVILGYAFSTSNSANPGMIYSSMITKIECGNVKLAPRIFARLSNCKSVSLPLRCISRNTNRLFDENTRLRGVVIPPPYTGGTTKLTQYTFNLCGSMRISLPRGYVEFSDYFFNKSNISKIWIPDTVTWLGSNFFTQNAAMSEITIPKSVATLVSSTFSNCRTLAKIRFTSTTPPSANSSGVFQYLPTDCKIYVPYSEDHSILNAYKTATNYPNPATYTYVEY